MLLHLSITESKAQIHGEDGLLDENIHKQCSKHRFATVLNIVQCSQDCLVASTWLYCTASCQLCHTTAEVTLLQISFLVSVCELEQHICQRATM